MSKRTIRLAVLFVLVSFTAAQAQQFEAVQVGPQAQSLYPGQQGQQLNTSPMNPYQGQQFNTSPMNPYRGQQLNTSPINPYQGQQSGSMGPQFQSPYEQGAAAQWTSQMPQAGQMPLLPEALRPLLQASPSLQSRGPESGTAQAVPQPLSAFEAYVQQKLNEIAAKAAALGGRGNGSARGLWRRDRGYAEAWGFRRRGSDEGRFSQLGDPNHQAVRLRPFRQGAVHLCACGAGARRTRLCHRAGRRDQNSRLGEGGRRNGPCASTGTAT